MTSQAFAFEPTSQNKEKELFLKIVLSQTFSCNASSEQ